MESGFVIQQNTDEHSIRPEPFSVIFTWGNEKKVISLVNGEDVFRLAEEYKRLLREADIPFVER